MELDIDTSDLFPEEPQPPIRIEVGAATNEVAESLVASMNALAERMEQAEDRDRQFVELLERVLGTVDADRTALTAAFNDLAEAVRTQPEPVVNVAAPVIPEPNITVQPPEVNVTVEAPAATAQRRVVVERDPLTGLISSASVEDAGP